MSDIFSLCGKNWEIDRNSTVNSIEIRYTWDRKTRG